MVLLMMNDTQMAALRFLYDLARQDRAADLALVAAELGLSCVETDAALERLERAGLVDAERVRLTMSGLVLAVSAAARRGAGRRRRRAASRAA